MANEANVSLIGFVATQPKQWITKNGSLGLSMRVGWTPRAYDRATGQWGDLPSSFLTVQCFRKIAEHAAVCVRRGDPIVVRGTLRVREYTDQSGQRRSAVELQAESIGHDMSRGLSTYSKLPTRTELTAEEYERSLAAERNPLPGDRDHAPADGAHEPEGGFGGNSEYTDDDMEEDAELAVGDEYDEPLAEHELTSADRPLDPGARMPLG